MNTVVAPPKAPKVVLVPLEDIDPNPHQPRRFKDDRSEVEDLAESIARHGVRQPILLRPVDGRKVLVFGERRTRACRLLGLADIPAIVEKMDDDEAFRLTMAENLQRKDLDPLDEAAAYSAMIARGWTLEDIAAEVGRPAKHVARRAKLADLCDDWLRVAADPKSKFAIWGPAHLELIARFTADQQRGFLTRLSKDWDLENFNPKRLKGWLGNEYHLLADAVFDCDDATLRPKDGACAACQRRSDCHPKLFDDTDWNTNGYGKPADGARCLDAACWNRKKQAHVDQKVHDLKAKHPDLHAVKGYGLKVPKGLPAVDAYQAKKGKKGEPGVVPAVEVSDAGQVKLTYVQKPKETPGSSTGSRTAPAAPSTPAELAAERREAWLFAKAADEIKVLLDAGLDANVTTPGDAILFSLYFGHDQYIDADLFWEEFDRRKRDKVEACARDLFAAVLTNIEGFVRYRDVDRAFVARLCGYLGINYAALEQEAWREIPDPAAKETSGAADAGAAAKPKKKSKAQATEAAEACAAGDTCSRTEGDECEAVGKCAKTKKGKRQPKAEAQSSDPAAPESLPPPTKLKPDDERGPIDPNQMDIEGDALNKPRDPFDGDDDRYDKWCTANCEGCRKAYDKKAKKYRCDIEEAISGCVTAEPGILKRMGYYQRGDNPVWACPEKEPVDEAPAAAAKKPAKAKSKPAPPAADDADDVELV